MLMDVSANLKHTIGLNHHEKCIIYHANVNVRAYYKVMMILHIYKMQLVKVS